MRRVRLGLAVAGVLLVPACITLNKGAESVRFADTTDWSNDFRHCKKLGPVRVKTMGDAVEAEKAVKNQAAALGGNVVREDTQHFVGTISGVAMKCGGAVQLRWWSWRPGP